MDVVTGIIAYSQTAQPSHTGVCNRGDVLKSELRLTNASSVKIALQRDALRSELKNFSADLSRELRRMGYRKLSAHSRHHVQKEGAIDAFE